MGKKKSRSSENIKKERIKLWEIAFKSLISQPSYKKDYFKYCDLSSEASSIADNIAMQNNLSKDYLKKAKARLDVLSKQMSNISDKYGLVFLPDPDDPNGWKSFEDELPAVVRIPNHPDEICWVNLRDGRFLKVAVDVTKRDKDIHTKLSDLIKEVRKLRGIKLKNGIRRIR